MNTLSWMIYIASVADDAQLVCVLGILACLFASGGFGLAAMFAGDQGDDEVQASRSKAAINLWKPVAAMAVFIVVVPSANTVYAIAASEMGERALNTATAGKAFKALDAWLDKQIGGTSVTSDNATK